MSEKWPIYRRRIYLLLLATAFILGVHGLYVYYRPLISRDWQLLSAMLYGTMKLFLFSPPLGVTAEVTLGYEIAKWLAPMLTSALVLTALANRALHLKNTALNLFGNHILIFGATPQAKAFLRSLKKTEPKFRKTLVSATPLSDDARHEFEKMGVAVLIGDPRHLTSKEREAFVKQVRLRQSQHILFLEDDENLNYQTFMSLLEEMKPSHNQKIHLQLETPVLRRYVEQALERAKLSDEDLRKLDLRFFTLSGLSIDRLLSNSKALHFVTGLLGKLQPGEDYLSTLAPIHLFILGVNSLSKELLLRSANDFVLGRNKVKVTLVDTNATEAIEDFWYQYPQLHQALDIEVHNSLPGKRSFDEVTMKNDYTALFLNHLNPLVNLQALEYFPADLPAAFRNQPGLDLSEIHKSHPGVIFYGDLSEIMTRPIVLQESLDQAARDFNTSYGEVASVLGSGGQVWEELSPTKKQSSRLSGAHASMKLALLEADTGLKGEELQAQLQADRQEFNLLVQSYQGEDFRQALIQYFKDKPYLERLSELEHRRWCYSYYAMGFHYGETKDEVRKTHPCLIESWDVLMNQAFFSCHPEYDLISALSLAGE